MAMYRLPRTTHLVALAACLAVFAPASRGGVGPDVPDYSTPANAEERPIATPQPAAAVEAAEAAPISGPPAKATGGSVAQSILALSAVVGVIVASGFAFKKLARKGGLLGALGPGGRAPSGLLEVIGRYPVARGTTLVLLKLDRRVMLLCQSGGGTIRGGASMTTLCEISEPEDVASILLKARDDEGDSLAQRFQSVLSNADGAFESGELHEAQPQAGRPLDARPPAVQSLRTRLRSMRSAEPAGVRR
jgi:flagellar biogenesis protein FliO